MEQSPSSETNNRSDSQETPKRFIEPEDSYPYSQELTSGPSPGPDESTP
jgi:hypothetical protein